MSDEQAPSIRVRGRDRTGRARLGPLRRAGGLALAAVGLAAGLAACSSAVALRSSSERERASYAAPTRDTIDWWDGEHVGLSITVNGIAAPAIVDSGSETTVLDRSFADQIDARLRGRLHGVGVGGAAAGHVTDGLSLGVGALRVEGVSAAVFDLSDESEILGRPLSVVLGENVLEKTVVDVDPTAGTIEFRDPGRFTPPRGATRVDLRRASKFRVLDVSIEGQPPVAVVFDLGSGAPLTLLPTGWRTLGVSNRPSSTSLSCGLGGMQESTICVLSSVRFAGFEVTSVPAQLEGSRERWLPAGVVGYVGCPLLRRFHLWVDYPHDALYVLPAPAAATATFAKDHLGLALLPDPSGLRVSHVAAGSPGARANVREGDVVVAIDDRPAASWTRRMLHRLALSPVGTPVRLRLADGSVRRLVLADYF